eukprot:gnl/MRDRNA2_/MRDRNA2_33088_c0_seq1.p1 gnl/MRDRNA2_/MRDRNA2_33088_c0~~gnl/MRDRNA2_/MRDRNA2_33088_c0_seq1.p1  ORF type:complete len:225 (+),score=23.09 gnl/MRDRNA2_/MRDRNA2_33088_c0_seq1:74-676(+)
MPPSVLGDCTDPISAGIPDHRGNWTNPDTGHWQIIEQCADRYTVSGPGANGLFYIHDFPHADGTEANGVADYNALRFPTCSAIAAVGSFNGCCMLMKVGEITGASRCISTDGQILTFTNAMVGTMTLKRVGGPPEHNTTCSLTAATTSASPDTLSPESSLDSSATSSKPSQTSITAEGADDAHSLQTGVALILAGMVALA